MIWTNNPFNKSHYVVNYAPLPTRRHGEATLLSAWRTEISLTGFNFPNKLKYAKDGGTHPAEFLTGDVITRKGGVGSW